MTGISAFASGLAFTRVIVLSAGKFAIPFLIIGTGYTGFEPAIAVRENIGRAWVIITGICDAHTCSRVFASTAASDQSP